MDSSLVSVIIPTFNRKEKLLRCISSVKESKYRPIEIIVVDDCSSDGTYDAVLEHFPDVKLIKNKEERYVSGCRNVGIEHSSGDILIFIDDDVAVDQDTISELSKFLKENEKIGIAGATVFTFSGRFYQAGVREIGKITCITHPYGKSDVEKAQQMRQPLHCETVVGDIFEVKREVIDKIGGFDSYHFPQMFTESDFCKRAALKGFTSVVVPSVRAWHDIPLEVSSESWLPTLLAINFRLSPKRLYDAARARVVFLRLYTKRLFFVRLFLFYLPIITSYYFILILRQPRKRLASLTAYTKGIRDAFKVFY